MWDVPVAALDLIGCIDDAIDRGTGDDSGSPAFAQVAGD
jgi:hypothetical protein